MTDKLVRFVDQNVVLANRQRLIWLGTQPFSGEKVTENGYRCEACGKEFDSEEELEAHVREVGLVE